jgi:two-component system LytT family response regulator
MPECDGFDVLELLGADLPETVIFVTAYDAYSLRAFEAGALDYILKSLDSARFGRALERAKGRLARDWIEAARYYASLHFGDATHIVRRSPQELEQDLDARTFFRIHRSIIVNPAVAQDRGVPLKAHASGHGASIRPATIS